MCADVCRFWICFKQKLDETGGSLIMVDADYRTCCPSLLLPHWKNHRSKHTSGLQIQQDGWSILVCRNTNFRTSEPKIPRMTTYMTTTYFQDPLGSVETATSLQHPPGLHVRSSTSAVLDGGGGSVSNVKEMKFEKMVPKKLGKCGKCGGSCKSVYNS